VNRGLRFLLWRDVVGRTRAMWRRLGTGRGIAAALGVGLFLVVIAFARILQWVDPEAAPAPLVAANRVRELGGLVLLLLVALNALSGRALYFRPAEIGVLFAAPLSRRELVVYNVLARARLAALSALWMAIVIDVRGVRWPAVLAGGFLALLFVQVASQLCSVALAWLAERLPPAPRRTALAAVVLLVVGPALAVAAAASAGGLAAMALAAAGSTPLRVLGLAARPSLELLLAQDLPSALAWGAACVAVLAILVEAIARLDVAYAEAAFARSQAFERRRARMRSGGGSLAGGRSSPRVRIPRFPRLRGAGPLAWRQCLELARNLRGVISMIVVMGVTIAVAVLAPALGDPDPERSAFAARLGLGIVVLMSIVLTQNFAFDFRRDVDRMAALKALPVPVVAVAAGQLVAATLFTTLLQVVGFAMVAVATDAFSPRVLLALALPLPALSWAAVAIDNAIFLLWPYRSVPEDPGDMGFMGRNMVIMAVKIGLLSLLVVAVAFAAGLVARHAGGGALVAGVVAAALLCAACAPLTKLVAWAFERFDVSRHVPA
jgi:hypothetical protein